ncbi:hypothetical protein C4K04_0688 [Pseudomonas chlororaphis]|uniref:Uncharacterized protein n=1 Tax=Pseudomonas chlororaphis TaxID=587753 RepID=A0A3G7TID3_9PSED|nr:hypothetical protein C4K04_0688 [Pseudomonas chlororaphis]
MACAIDREAPLRQGQRYWADALDKKQCRPSLKKVAQCNGKKPTC